MIADYHSRVFGFQSYGIASSSSEMLISAQFPKNQKFFNCFFLFFYLFFCHLSLSIHSFKPPKPEILYCCMIPKIVKVFQYKDRPIGKRMRKSQSLTGKYIVIVTGKRWQNHRLSFFLLSLRQFFFLPA